VSAPGVLSRRGARVALLAASAAALAFLVARPAARGPSAGGALDRAGAAAPEPPALSAASPGAPASSARLVLTFPSRTRAQDASVLVSLGAGGAERASFVVTTSPRTAQAHDVRSPGATMVADAVLDDATSEVRVDLRSVPEGVTDVQARTIDLGEPALAAAPAPWPPEGREPVLRLALEARDPAGWIAVRARREGDALGGVALHLRRGEEILRSFSTRADRRVVVRVPPSEALELHVADYAGLALLGVPEPVAVRVGERAVVDVDVVLPPGRRVAFRALDPNGESASFALALWRAGDGGRPRHVALAGLVVADAEHRVWRGVLAPGAYLAAADPRAHFSPATMRVEVGSAPPPGSDGGTEEQAFSFAVADRGVRTSVRLSEPDGRPLSRVLVTLDRAADRVEGLATHGTTTDGDGALRTPPLPAGEYRLFVWPRGLVGRVALGEGTPVERALPDVACGEACGRVRGTVTDAEGAPARWPKVFLLRPDGWAHVATPDAAGRFAFPSLLPGEYGLEVEASLYSENAYEPHRDRVRVEAGGEAVRDVVLRSR
jgi:hypothetical protein